MQFLKTIYILLIAVTTCSACNSLNQSIYKSQKKAIKNEVCKNQERMFHEIKLQRKIRKNYLNAYADFISEYDTLIFVEDYVDFCIYCNSDLRIGAVDSIIQIDERVSLIPNQSKFDLDSYSIFTSDSDTIYCHDIRLLIKASRNGMDLNEFMVPWQLKDCYDGAHTIYTIMLPNRELTSYYTRCGLD